MSELEEGEVEEKNWREGKKRGPMLEKEQQAALVKNVRAGKQE